jgi:hypothetical protein
VPSDLSSFVIAYRGRPDGQLLQPSGQPFEMLVCAQFLQAVNTDLNRLGVVVSDTVDVFGITHFDHLRPLRCRGDEVGSEKSPPDEEPGS